MTWSLTAPDTDCEPRRSSSCYVYNLCVFVVKPYAKCTCFECDRIWLSMFNVHIKSDPAMPQKLRCSFLNGMRSRHRATGEFPGPCENDSFVCSAVHATKCDALFGTLNWTFARCCKCLCLWLILFMYLLLLLLLLLVACKWAWLVRWASLVWHDQAVSISCFTICFYRRRCRDPNPTIRYFWPTKQSKQMTVIRFTHWFVKSIVACGLPSQRWQWQWGRHSLPLGIFAFRMHRTNDDFNILHVATRTILNYN